MRKLAILMSVAALATAARADDALKRTDHDVVAASNAPSLAGQQTHIYAREVAKPDLKGAGAGVVLFVHGVGLSSPAFDVAYKDYSWAAFLAKAGFDVFAMDLTGYGRSTRPAAMADPCNAPKTSQAQFVPGQIPAPCPPSSTKAITSIDSDADDIAAVVDHLRALRHVDKVSIIAWSLGGARTVNYLTRHPGAVSRLVLLAPLYNRAGPDGPPQTLNYENGPITTQSQAEFMGAWKRQMACPDEAEDGVGAAFFADVLAADPLGAKWGAGVRRAPQMPAWVFNQAAAAKVQLPVLVISGANDTSAPPESVHNLFGDLGSSQKYLVDVACTSHYGMLEKNHLLLFQASLDWLKDGKIGGQSSGSAKLGN